MSKQLEQYSDSTSVNGVYKKYFYTQQTSKAALCIKKNMISSYEKT